jgi:hypothetical protein
LQINFKFKTMRKLCLTLVFILVISLNSRAPNLDRTYLEQRFEHAVQTILDEIAFNKRVDLLLETIKYIESRNNYHLKGKSKEYGSYQFTRATWRYYSYMFFRELLDITIPENQDKVARSKVEMLVRNGFTNEEIAAFWNSGSRNNWQYKIGRNRYGVRYNVPRYVEKFIKIKNELKV